MKKKFPKKSEILTIKPIFLKKKLIQKNQFNFFFFKKLKNKPNKRNGSTGHANVKEHCVWWIRARGAERNERLAEQCRDHSAEQERGAHVAGHLSVTVARHHGQCVALEHGERTEVGADQQLCEDEQQHSHCDRGG